MGNYRVGSYVEFVTICGTIKTGTISSIQDKVVYVVPDGGGNSIPTRSIKSIIEIQRIGKKPFFKTEPHHFTQEQYVKRTKPPIGLDKRQLLEIHRLFVQLALENQEVVPDEVLADYPDLCTS